MGRLDEAIKRLDAAVDGLENALSETTAGEVDKESLASELEQAKRDYAALASTTDEVNARLDSAIGRLKFVLDT